MTQKTPSFGVEPEKTQASRLPLLIVGGLAVVTIIAFALFTMSRPPPSTSDSAASTQVIAAPLAQTFEIQGQTHIEPGAAHPPYNSNPPTSGWHYAQWAPWGIYNETIDDGYLVHNLEHGGVWVSYRDANDTATIDQLKFVISNDPDRVIMTYRPQNDSAIAVASWGVLMKLDAFDGDAIRNFIQQNRYHAPENVP